MMSGVKALSERRLDDAIREFSKAVALDPKYSAPHRYLGEAYLAKGRPEFIAKAKGEFIQARDLNPKDTFASFFVSPPRGNCKRRWSATRMNMSWR